MLKRILKFKSFANMEFRGGAVLLDGFTPDAFSMEVIDILNDAGIPDAILHGGALRDSIMRQRYGYSGETADYDVIASLESVEPYWSEGNSKNRLSTLYNHLAKQGFSLDETTPKGKEKLELLQGVDDKGNERTVITLRLVYENKRVGIVLLDKFDGTPQLMATRGYGSFTSFGMKKGGIVYADKNFYSDIEVPLTEGISPIFRVYEQDSGSLEYIIEARKPDLDQRFGWTSRFLHDPKNNIVLNGYDDPRLEAAF